MHTEVILDCLRAVSIKERAPEFKFLTFFIHLVYRNDFGRMKTVLTMVYNTQNYWLSGLCS
jgi:hypothetical protein